MERICITNITNNHTQMSYNETNIDIYDVYTNIF